MGNTFPKSFYFGAATSSHQVEGGNHNDWTDWEQKNAVRLAEEAKKKGWLNFILKRSPSPLEEKNYISGQAADHYNLFEKDFDSAKDLGHNAHRFSIEWSRIEPAEGRFNEKEIAHYRRVVSALRERKMEPFVTLWHWTLPLWLSRKGGVRAKNFPEYFSHYTERMARELPEVKFWITLNEPNIYCDFGYYKGTWPPEKKGVVNFYAGTVSLIRAHRKAYKTIKAALPHSQIGTAQAVTCFESAPGVVSPCVAWVAKKIWNEHFLNHIKRQMDFIGVNYYGRNRVKNFSFNTQENVRTSDMGWGLYPEGTKRVLEEMSHYRKPIYITENGLADARDEHRAWFIEETLKSVSEAMQEGVDVRGYLHWSLLDNFEWDKGFWPRFGLIEINYKTMKRTVRPSAFAYKALIEEYLGRPKNKKEEG